MGRYITPQSEQLLQMDHGVHQKAYEKSSSAMKSGLSKLGEFAYDMVVPQDALDVGLMLIGGPFGKVAKKAGAALIGMETEDAQAGGLGKILRSLGDESLSLRHNLGVNKLRHVAETGRLSHPSLGVIRGERPFTSFGSYTMVMDPKKIKPTPGSPLYSRDAYTPRGPGTTRLGEHLASDILLNEDQLNPTQLLAVQNAPMFTKGWKEFKDSPVGARILATPEQYIDYDSYYEDTMALLKKYGISLEDVLQGKPVPEEIVEYTQKLPSEYAELKMSRDVVPSEAVRLISGPMDKNVRSMALDLGVSFIPTKSHLRRELPQIIKEFNADFAKGGLVAMQQRTDHG